MEFTCEYKYDGFRGQIHYDRSKRDEGKECLIYSRNLELLSRSYPDVIENIIAFTPPHIENYIMDSELVAYDIEKEKILPF